MNNHYTSANTIISVSGNFDDTFFELLEKYFGTKKMLDTKLYLPDAPYISKNNIVKEKDIEQVQLVATFKGIDVMDESVYSLLVFNNVFGRNVVKIVPKHTRTAWFGVFDKCGTQCVYQYGRI